LVHTDGWGEPAGVTLPPGVGHARLRVVPPAPDEWLTVREAAAGLRVSTATVYKLVASGHLDHVRVGNSIRIPRSVLKVSRAVP
jgi:excisionase family DNA binding protein